MVTFFTVVSHMHKITGVLCMAFTVVFGGGALMNYAAFGGGTYSGHTGYCRDVELPFFHGFCLAVLLFGLLLLLYWIVVETFTELKPQALRGILVCSLPVLAASLSCVLRYPFVNRSYGFISQSGRQEGLHNPLLTCGAIAAGILLLFTLRFRRRMPGRITVVACAAAAVFLITSAAVYAFARYQSCFG